MGLTSHLKYTIFFDELKALEEEPIEKIDLSCFSGNLRRDDRENTRDCWRISDGNNFRVRSKHFCYNKTKVSILQLVSFNYFFISKSISYVFVLFYRFPPYIQ